MLNKKNNGGRPRKSVIAEASIFNGQDYYTVPELVTITGLHRHTIQARLRDGTIKGKKLSGVWRVYKSEIPILQKTEK